MCGDVWLKVGIISQCQSALKIEGGVGCSDDNDGLLPPLDPSSFFELSWAQVTSFLQSAQNVWFLPSFLFLLIDTDSNNYFKAKIRFDLFCNIRYPPGGVFCINADGQEIIGNLWFLAFKSPFWIFKNLSMDSTSLTIRDWGNFTIIGVEESIFVLGGWWRSRTFYFFLIAVRFFGGRTWDRQPQVSSHPWTSFFRRASLRDAMSGTRSICACARSRTLYFFLIRKAFYRWTTHAYLFTEPRTPFTLVF